MWLKLSVTVFTYLLVGCVTALAVLVIIGWVTRVVLWGTGAKDLAEIDSRMNAANARFQKTNAEWREQRRARGEPATLAGVLNLLGRRIWTAYAHPIRAWRGEFDPPKKRTTEVGDRKP